MTKIKKTLALVMVLVMAVTTLILPVSATESDVEPASAVAICEKCGGTITTTTTTSSTTAQAAAPCTASNSPMVHYHRVDTTTYYSVCASCENTTTQVVKRNYCETLDKYF